MDAGSLSGKQWMRRFLSYSKFDRICLYGVCHLAEERRKVMTKRQKKLFIASIVFAAVFGIAPNANAMHIMEGYLPLGFCIAWELSAFLFW